MKKNKKYPNNNSNVIKKRAQNNTQNLEVVKQKEASSQTEINDNLGELVAIINIELKAPKEEEMDFENGILPWINIEYAKEDLDYLIDGDKVIIDADEIKLIIDYPLKHPTSIILKTNDKGFTKKQLITEISEEYIKIYNLEEKTCQTKTVPMDKRKMNLNRNQTHGKYGIWGHDLVDLNLSTIEIYKDKTGEISILLGVDS